MNSYGAISPAVVLRELDKFDAERSLYDFIRIMWPIVEPNRAFVGGWVLEGWCEHLEAVTRGEIQRLLGNVPPGCSKSLSTSVLWPAWEHGPKRMPSMRYMCAAYGSHLTFRDNRRYRAIVTHPAYRAMWGDVFTVIGEAVEQIINDRTGWKLATSVGGVGTGERADRIIVDDPNNPQEVESQVVMEATTLWYREVLPDRLNDISRSAIVTIQQRTHQADISGLILDQGFDYVHFQVPMPYDPLRHCTTVLGWQDPRGLGEDGELLPEIVTDARGNPIVLPGSPLDERVGMPAWPELFPEDKLAEIYKQKGEYAVAAQYFMLPVPRGGGIIKDSWWRLWPHEEFPPYGTCVGSVDTAFKEGEHNDYSAMTVWGAFQHPETLRPALMLREAWQERLNLAELTRRVIRSCREHKIDTLLIEDSARATDLNAEIFRLIGGRETSIVLVPTGRLNKVQRTHAVVPVFENGIVYAPDKEWADMVIRQVSAFSGRGNEHDDLHDTVIQAITYMRTNGVATRSEEYDEEVLARRMFKKPAKALYDV